MHFSGDPYLYLELDGAVRLFIAALLGSLIGLERSIAGKHAGMRTYALVSMGSAIFTLAGTIASYQLSLFPGLNPLQIAASIVIGIGFIGSGLAVFRGDHPVELTTAAGIWVAAGIGMFIGYGLYLLGIAATLISILIFAGLNRVEYAAQSKFGDPPPHHR